MTPTGDGGLQVFPGGMAVPTAGVDDTGQQGEVTRPPGRASAVADLPQDQPMPQGAFGLVVGQRPKQVREDGEDRLPVVQKLDRERMRLGMWMPPHCFATAAKRLQALLPLGAQGHAGRAFAGLLDGLPEVVPQRQGLQSEALGGRIQAVGQALPGKVRPRPLLGPGRKQLQPEDGAAQAHHPLRGQAAGEDQKHPQGVFPVRRGRGQDGGALLPRRGEDERRRIPGVA